MKPFEPNHLPCEYKVDRDLLKLVSEASMKYGEYKSLLHTLAFDSTLFLDSLLIKESYKSTQIEGTQISEEDVYTIKYLKHNDDCKEIENLKSAIEFGYQTVLKNQWITQAMVNEMHGILMDSVRGSHKQPGKIRTTQNWIGTKGSDIQQAIFIPPKPERLMNDLINLIEYMNDEFIDPLLVNIALSHAQFETIHAYLDGNGRLGRALIPVQMALLDHEQPILYLSQILELYKPSYQRVLMEYRKGNVNGYLKFMMQCMIEQCNAYISKIHKMKEIYEEDMLAVKQIKGNSVYKIMPVIMKQVVFTKKEVQVKSQVSVNVVSNIINQLVALGILVSDTSVLKKGYRYQRIYDLFIRS